MKVTVKMPKLAESTDEVVIIDLIAEPGASLARGDLLVEVETDKTTVVVPSPVNGSLKEFMVDVDDEVATGAPFAVIETKGN